jgi:hypothetical protein
MVGLGAGATVAVVEIVRVASAVRGTVGLTGEDDADTGVVTNSVVGVCLPVGLVV